MFTAAKRRELLSFPQGYARSHGITNEQLQALGNGMMHGYEERRQAQCAALHKERIVLEDKQINTKK